ncbi:hypothetical protein R3P38DRAFT_3360107 [Favolaschia claudopus]|uniref:Uncharacterized protein n=1 Tax=Favolaschia claudopus TaxID=2862362 RepID=A0AAW0B1E9_9AGAR
MYNGEPNIDPTFLSRTTTSIAPTSATNAPQCLSNTPPRTPDTLIVCQTRSLRNLEARRGRVENTDDPSYSVTGPELSHRSSEFQLSAASFGEVVLLAFEHPDGVGNAALIYTPTSVEAHSHDYITTDGIDAAQLRQFVDNGCHHRGSASYPPKSTPRHAKVENNASATRCVDCTGAYVCERADRRLPEVERRELDIGSGDRVFAAQRQTRRDEGTTAERKAVEFAQLIRNRKCFGVDKNGAKRNDVSVLRGQKQTFNSHNHFVGCSGWTKDFTNHRSSVLPLDLDESLFITAFHGQSLNLSTTNQHLA